MKTLASCKIGEKVLVENIQPCDIQSKLMEMGIYEGKEIQIVYKAPFGDPIAIEIGDYVLSMRMNEAELIVVKEISHD